MGSYCQYCGAKLASEARYCPECGEPVGGTAEADRAKGDSQSESATSGRQHDRVERGEREQPASQQQSQGGDEWGNQSSETEEQAETRDTTVAAITHLLGLFTWVLGPLLVYIVADDPFVKENAANATNWQIILAVYLVVSGMLVIVLVGLILLPLVAILDLAFCLIAAVKASNGETWSYPLTPDLL